MNTLKQKLGPLPVWGWLALVTVILLGYYLWKSKSASSSSAGTTTSDTAPEIVVQTGGQGTTPATAATPIPDQGSGDNVQGSTPPSEPGFTAADQQELAALTASAASQNKRLTGEEKQIGHLNRKTGIAPKQTTVKKGKPQPRRPGGGRNTGGGAPPARPRVAARHAATAHPVRD